jgi:outer membrane cobalamin receptor
VPLATDSRNTALGAEGRYGWTALPWLSVAAGYALRVDRLTGNALGEAHRRASHGLYAQASVEPLAGSREEGFSLLVQPAVRWDAFSDFGAAASPKLGLVVAAGRDPRLTLKANAGRSFRAPTFNDLYWPRDYFTAGNPALEPERATDLDAGLHLRSSWGPGLQAGFTWFQTDIRDLILWQPGAEGLWQPANVGRAFTRGLETEAWAGPVAGAVRLGWTYTFLRALNRSGVPEEEGRQLPYRPAHLHRFIVRLEAGDFHGEADYMIMSRRYTTTANTGLLAGFTTMDLSLGYRLSAGPSSVELLLLLRNLGDTRYMMADGYPLPGREARLTLGFGFGGARERGEGVPCEYTTPGDGHEHGVPCSCIPRESGLRRRVPSG